MQKRNSNSNRRNFNIFSDNIGKPGKTPQNNPIQPDYFESYLFPEKNSNSEHKNRKSYSYMSIKTTPIHKSENTLQEKFLNVILVIAVIVAAICMCLSIASMFMFFCCSY